MELHSTDERWIVRIHRELLDMAHGRWLWSEAAQERWRLRDREALRQVARSAQARPILTACVLAHWGRVETDTWPEPLDPAPAKAWLDALRAAGVTQVEDADRLAWAAYRAGDFAAAEEWLRRAPAKAPMALWVRARLRIRLTRACWHGSLRKC